jgi:transketolase
VPVVSQPDDPFLEGAAILLRPGTDVTLVAIGSLVSRALWAADQLSADGIEARVLNMPFVEPLDTAAVLAAAAETGGIVTAEEAVATGGLGAAVAAAVVQAHPCPMRILGVSGFAPTGDTGYLLDHFGLSADGIAHAARDVIARGSR